MNTEQLINKKVKHKFHKKNKNEAASVLFEVSSLNSKFEGLVMHKTDYVDIDGKDYINPRNVDFSAAKKKKKK
jgi:hypothetical protein